MTFSSVSRKTGLAGASLVQRYGGLDGMVRFSLAWGWTQLETALAEAESSAEDRGAHSLLKAVADRAAEVPVAALLAASQRDPALRDRAAAWRDRVQTALTARGEGAEMLFALWMGQWFWEPLGGKSFKLKDAARKLG